MSIPNEEDGSQVALRAKLDVLLDGQNKTNLFLERLNGRLDLQDVVIGYQKDAQAKLELAVEKALEAVSERLDKVESKQEHNDRWRNMQLGAAAMFGAVGGYAIDMLFGRSG